MYSEVSPLRELTFAGFLARYAQALSLSEARGLYKLAREAQEGNVRLREPLFLYAFFSGRTDLLLKATKNPPLKSEYQKLAAMFDKNSLLDALRGNGRDIPKAYRDVYRSYLSERDKMARDNHSKMLMNTFLKNGDVSRVSLQTARSVLAYLAEAGS